MSFLFLDQSSVRHHQFNDLLQNNYNKIVISDVYLTEFSLAHPSTLMRHLDTLAQMRDRVYVATGAGALLRKELEIQKRVNRGHVIRSDHTKYIRERLLNIESLASWITSNEQRDRVISERYSEEIKLQRFKEMVKIYERAMHAAKFRGKAGELIPDSELTPLIHDLRYAILDGFQKRGWSPTEAKRFALCDSYHLRIVAAFFLRAMDWAQSHGIESQSTEQLYNEDIDLEYVTTASYFDEFLVYENRSKRNFSNLKRLLHLAPEERKIRQVSGITIPT